MDRQPTHHDQCERHSAAKVSGISFIVCALVVVWLLLYAGCAQCRIPRFDPTGERIFLPRGNTTNILTPTQTPVTQPALGVPTAPVGSGLPQQPVFTPVPQAPACNGCNAQLGQPILQPTGSLISHRESRADRRKKPGQLIMTPSRIIAPVGSEVVVMAGVCGEDGHFILNQPLEWMLSQDSAGQIVEVGGMDHKLLNAAIKPSSAKIDGDYAWGRTSLKPKLITRGTDTKVDDIQILKGQAWLTVSSASQGTSYLTCVAPKTKGWPQRKGTTRIHWVDGVWSIPMPSTATAGSIHPLNVVVSRTSDGTGVAGWKVRYQIVGGTPAEFHPDGTQQAEIVTNATGQAPIQIRQPAGQTSAGTTQIRVDIVRPALYGEREMVLESGITTVTWSSPALTIRAIGPRSAGINEPIEYRLEVTNPGDQVARNVVVSTNDITGDTGFISSNPKPSSFGDRLQWSLGDIQPGARPSVILAQLKTARRGPLQLCFEVASETDQLRTEACAETQVEAPCILLTVNGPERANVGDNVTFGFDVTNDCDRVLEDVVFRVQYDPGMPVIGVANPVEYGPIPSLAPGQSANIPDLHFQAIEAGTHGFLIEVTSKAGDIARSQQYVQVENVVDAKVRVEMESHRVVRLGENVLVRMRVTNVGNVPLENVTLINQFSRSMTPTQRSPVPQRWIGDDLAFDLGRLEASQQTTVEILFDTLEVDNEAYSRAFVQTPLAASDKTGVNIQIQPRDGAGAGAGGQPGIEAPIQIPGNAGGQAAAYGISVSPVNPSVVVGNQAVFRVSVRNNQTIADQQVVVTLVVPPGARLIPPDPTQTGMPGAFIANDGTEYRFEPRAQLGAGQTIDFQVALETQQVGAATIFVQVNSSRSVGTAEQQGSVTVTQQ